MQRRPWEGHGGRRAGEHEGEYGGSRGGTCGSQGEHGGRSTGVTGWEEHRRVTGWEEHGGVTGRGLMGRSSTEVTGSGRSTGDTAGRSLGGVMDPRSSARPPTHSHWSHRCPLRSHRGHLRTSPQPYQAPQPTLLATAAVSLKCWSGQVSRMHKPLVGWLPHPRGQGLRGCCRKPTATQPPLTLLGLEPARAPGPLHTHSLPPGLAQPPRPWSQVLSADVTS